MSALARDRASRTSTAAGHEHVGSTPARDSVGLAPPHAGHRRGQPPHAVRDALVRVLLGAAAASTASRALSAAPLPELRWQRPNSRGRTVSLRSGPALALALAATTDLPRTAAVVVALGAAAVGRYDDRTGGRHPAKGVRGHVAALRSGQLTSGTVKVVALSGVGLAGAVLLDRPRRPARELLVDGAVVAGAANLLNLLDLRPGRALKAGCAAAVLLRQPVAAGATAALLPGDLHERSMLGDCGANALGAGLGLALVSAHPERRTRALAALALLTALSEVVSYSRVIEAVPGVRWADRAGRLP